MLKHALSSGVSKCQILVKLVEGHGQNRERRMWLLKIVSFINLQVEFRNQTYFGHARYLIANV